MSIGRRMDKDDVVCIYIYICVCVCVCVYMHIYIYNEILLSHKKGGNNFIYSNIDIPRNYHTKCSKPDKDKYHMISLISEI